MVDLFMHFPDMHPTAVVSTGVPQNLRPWFQNCCENLLFKERLKTLPPVVFFESISISSRYVMLHTPYFKFVDGLQCE